MFLLKTKRIHLQRIGFAQSRNFWWGKSSDSIEKSAEFNQGLASSVHEKPVIHEMPFIDPQLVENAVSQKKPILDVVSQIGDFKSLGLATDFGPTSLLQQLVELVHVYGGLPWWGTIVGSAILVRMLLFPISVYGQKGTNELAKFKPMR